MYVHLGHFLISVKQIIKFNTEEAEALNYRTRLFMLTYFMKNEIEE